MRNVQILDVLKEKIGFKWNEPFWVSMGVIRYLVTEHGFRLNRIMWAMKTAEDEGIASIIRVPEGSEPDKTVIVEFPVGISPDFHARNMGKWYNNYSFLSTVRHHQWHQDPTHLNPRGIPYRMRVCRWQNEKYGFAYEEQKELFVQLEKDGYMKVLKFPDESLPDDEVVAVLVRTIPDRYYDEHMDQWK